MNYSVKLTFLFLTFFGLGLNSQTLTDSEITAIKKFNNALTTNSRSEILTLFELSEISINNLRDSLGYNYFLCRKNKYFQSGLYFTADFLMHEDTIISWSVKPEWEVTNMTDFDNHDTLLEINQKKIFQELQKTGWSFSNNTLSGVTAKVFDYKNSIAPREGYSGILKPGVNKNLDTLMSVHTDSFYKNEQILKLHKKFSESDLTYLLYSTDPIVRVLVARIIHCKKKKVSETTNTLIKDIVKNSPRIKVRNGCVISRQPITSQIYDCVD